MARPRHEDQSAEAGYFAAYAKFAGTLRTWLVAYGVGGPALILTQEKLAARFVASPTAKTIIVCFLLGVGAQVMVALLYKTAMWYLYRGETVDGLQESWQYSAASWLSEAYFLETCFDLASIVLFGVATYQLLTIFVA